MTRRAALLLVLLIGACATSNEASRERSAPEPGREPIVRVHLASQGEWSTVRVGGKDGLIVEAGGKPFEATDVVLRRRGGAITIDGRPGEQFDRVFLRPTGGVFTIGDRAYSGELVCRGPNLINHVPMENYVLGVLRGELPLGHVPVAAAEAQAIAVRSYTLHYLRAGRAGFDLDDTTQYQIYAGLRYAARDENLRAGVQATRGLYLDYQGAPVKAYYHSTCGGHTTDVHTGLNRPAVAVMPGVACDWCKQSRYYRWSADLEDAPILAASGLGGSEPVLRVAKPGTGGRAVLIEITTSSGSKTMLASEFRIKAGPSKLRSTCIHSAHRVEGAVHLEGAGWGHGVGLCQMGSIGQADAGRAGREIASYYYPGAEIRRMY